MLNNLSLILAFFLISTHASALQIGPKIKLKTTKYRYCVIVPIAHNVTECRDCWSRIGGEGGRVDCGVRVGPGSVNYGRCNEQANCPQ